MHFNISSQPTIVRYIGEVTEITKRILELRNLPNGWHYGSGEAASQSATETAIEVSRLLRSAGAQKINVFPDVDGRVLLNADIENTYHEFICESTSCIEHIPDDGEIQEKTYDDVLNFLGGLECRALSDWYTRSTMTMSVIASYRPHLASPKRTKVSQ